MSSKPQASQSNESITSDDVNVTQISDQTKELFAKQDIRIGKLIRKGKYGAVYDGQFGDKFAVNQFAKDFKCDSCQTKPNTKTSKRFALKYVDIPVRKQFGVEDVAEAVQREIAALLAVQFEGIVDFYLAVNLSQKNQWFLFLELADGNLQVLLRHRRRSTHPIRYNLEAKKWIVGLAQTLNYLHSKCITHGQIKASNVLYFTDKTNADRIQVKLSDFISAKIWSVEKDEDRQLMEDRMNDDLLDLFSLLTVILNSTDFETKDTEQISRETIATTLLSSEGNSTQALNALLRSDHFSK